MKKNVKEGGAVKLYSLRIKKLYDHYDYNDIQFNPDVTFIFGSNGCGKTTILNITEIIVTGRIYKLASYDFQSIQLTYINEQQPQIKHNITVVRDVKELVVTFEGASHKLPLELALMTYNIDSQDVENEYFKMYDFLLKIRDTFNYVYLPITRAEQQMSAVRKSIIPLADLSYSVSNVRATEDEKVSRVEKLIQEKTREINYKVNQCGDTFRNNVLKSLLSVNEQYNDSQELIQKILRQCNDVDGILQVKKSYIKILNELSLISHAEEKDFAKFFDDAAQEAKNRASKITVPTVLKLNEIIRIKRIVELAENMEAEKGRIRKPVELFLKIVNEFIGSGEEKKKIGINSKGEVYFSVEPSQKHISIQKLSSGEKQIVIFFAYLIFKVNPNESGIFIVDEPELSLHLAWQMIFVAKMQEVNPNIQLIFATHAPEIIGRNRSKTFRLQKKYTD